MRLLIRFLGRTAAFMFVHSWMRWSLLNEVIPFYVSDVSLCALVVFVTFAVRSIQRAAQEDGSTAAEISSTESAAAWIGALCIVAQLTIVGAISLFLSWSAYADPWKVMGISFSEYLLLDVGFSLLAMRFHPPDHRFFPFGDTILAFLGVFTAFGSGWLFSVHLDYDPRPSLVAVALLIIPTVEILYWFARDVGCAAFLLVLLTSECSDYNHSDSSYRSDILKFYDAEPEIL